jgi:hypothetical protein
MAALRSIRDRKAVSAGCQSISSLIRRNSENRSSLVFDMARPVLNVRASTELTVSFPIAAKITMPSRRNLLKRAPCGRRAVHPYMYPGTVTSFMRPKNLQGSLDLPHHSSRRPASESATNTKKFRSSTFSRIVPLRPWTTPFNRILKVFRRPEGNISTYPVAVFCHCLLPGSGS